MRLSVSPASEHVCVGAAEDGTVCMKEHLEHYYPPHAGSVNPHNILGGRLRYLDFTEGSKELSPTKGSQGYCDHTATVKLRSTA